MRCVPKILKQNKPARHKRAVVFCADANVVRFAQFIANQIMQAEPERDFDICVTTFDENLVMLEKCDPEIRICQVDEAPFSALKTDKRITSTAYILLALPEIFAQEYEKIVYLDTDVFLRKGKISELFAAGSTDHAVLGSMDSIQWHKTPSDKQIGIWEALGISDQAYLNTGVLVLDVEKCNAENFYHGSMEVATSVGNLKKEKPWLKLEMSVSKQVDRLNKINPFYYTKLRGLIPMCFQYRTISKIERAIKAGAPFWPHSAMDEALK